MAAINVTINGVICDLYGRTITGPVKVVGEMMYTDRGVGGGPIYPQPPDQPPGIWPGPGDPDFPGGGKPPGQPPSIWPGPGDPDFPGPPGGGQPPDPPTQGKPPPPDGGWGYSPEYGWGYFPGPGEAGPKA